MGVTESTLEDWPEVRTRIAETLPFLDTVDSLIEQVPPGPLSVRAAADLKRCIEDLSATNRSALSLLTRALDRIKELESVLPPQSEARV